MKNPKAALSMQPKNIIILLIIALAGLILGVSTSNLFGDPKEDERLPAPAPTPGGKPITELPQIGLPKNFPQPPTADATVEETSDFAQLVFNLATETNAIDIYKNCDLSPAIVLVPGGTNIKFSNRDSISHTIRILEEMVIPAGEEYSLIAEFQFGPGIYGIYCDSTSKDIAAKGYLHIPEET